MVEDNIIFIGKKPSMAYVLSIVTQFNEGQKEVMIKARGQSISKAVDVAEIVKTKFFKNAQIENISISTEIIKDNKEDITVSVIEIPIKK